MSRGMNRLYAAMLMAFLGVVVGPRAMEAAGKITGVSASPSTARVGQPVTFTISGTGGPCSLKLDFVGGNWGGGPSVTTSLTIPNTWGPGVFNSPTSPGTATITVTPGPGSPACEVQGGKQTTTVTINPVQAGILEWKANPVKHDGPCPATINFSGKISVDYSPTPVYYTFIRSDGATAPQQGGNFMAAENPVQTSWKLGGPSLPNPSGWMKLKMIYPTKKESEKASFEVNCKFRAEPPRKIVPELVPKPVPGPPPVEKR